MNKTGLKRFGKVCWEFLTFIAYLKFYLFCLMTGALVLVLSIFVLSEHGGEYESIAKVALLAIYWMSFWVGIIMIDKFIKDFKIGKLAKRRKQNE